MTHNKRGQPTKLPAVRDDLLQAIRLAHSVKLSCQYVGIDPSTYHNWIRRGHQEQTNIDKGNNPNPTEAQYLDFFHDAQRARAHNAMRRLARIDKAAADGDWRADAWALERMYPDVFAQQQRHKIDGEVEVSGNVTADSMNRFIGEALGDIVRESERPNSPSEVGE